VTDIEKKRIQKSNTTQYLGASPNVTYKIGDCWCYAINYEADLKKRPKTEEKYVYIQASLFFGEELEFPLFLVSSTYGYNERNV